MSEPDSFPPNPETRGTVPVQFFEADDGAPSAGTKATPRPADRPRELPASGPGPASFQVFQYEAIPGPRRVPETPRPADQ